MFGSTTLTRKSIDSALRDTEIVKAIPAKELHRLASLGTEIHVSEDTEIVRQDTVGREVLFIVEGTLAVDRDGHKVAELGPGHFVGELSLITGFMRNATVTATADSRLYAFNRREFSTLLDDCPRLSHHILTTAMARAA